MNVDTKNKIVGIDQIDILTNGSLEDFKTIKNPNQVGSVRNKDDDTTYGEITPLIMIINQGSKDWLKRTEILIGLGADPTQRINYYGNPMNAKEVYHRKWGMSAKDVF
jgi:hypothetical protein